MRKMTLFPILLGIALTLLVRSPGEVGAQSFTCVATAAVPPVLRAEGLAESVGDLVLDCTGTGTGGNADFTLFVNTSVTSRLLASPTSEALLMINEPPPGSQVLNTNIFQGRSNSGNSILWQNIPVNPPGAGGHLIFRITNVRVNASGVSVPGQIQGLISASGSILIPINNPTQVLAFTQAGGNSFSVTSSRFDQEKAPGVGGNPTGLTLTFREGFPNAFKKKIEGTDQEVPGFIYSTESGFTSSVTGNAGRADTGTRLIARFAGVPAGVTLSVPSEVAGSVPGSTAVLVSVTDLNGIGGSAESPIPPPGIVTLAAGTGAATWEITNASPLGIEEFSIPVTVSYTPNPGAGIPGLGTAIVSTDFAPISTVTTASSTAPLPRFVPPVISRPAFTIFRRALFSDFDGDRKTDIAFYRTSTGVWWVTPSSGAPAYGYGWGGPGFKPVPGDYDGDRKTDIAIYDTTVGAWWIIPSSGTGPQGQAGAYGVGWGGSALKPVLGDYDGDGKTDTAIYDTTGGAWWIIPSSGIPAYGVGWGGSGFKPVPGDYDGDGKTDIAIYDATVGAWWVIPSSGTGPQGQAGAYGVGWGGSAFKPVPGDYDGDGKADIAIYNNTNGGWWIIPSSGTGPQGQVGAYGVGWGGTGFTPVPGDYDGDGKTDVAIYQSGNGGWWIIYSSDGSTHGMGWGGDASDVPLTSNPD